MKKLSLCTFYILALTVILHSQNIDGKWKGDLSIQTIKLPLVLNITQQNNIYTVSLLSPMQSAKAIDADSVGFTDNVLSVSIKAINAIYTATYEGDSLRGTFTQNGAGFPLTLNRATGEAPVINRPQTPRPPFNYNIEEVSFTNKAEGNTLAGTLTTPKEKDKFPVVVMITGSGAQNRDEELFGHRPFLVIADYLTKNGIGVLRMDDRGIGGSTPGKKEATSADFATDISAAVEYLKEKGYKTIGLIGHSEGGMIAPIVAAGNQDVKFVVSMAGPGIPIEQLMVLQTRQVLKSNGAPTGKIEEEAKDAAAIYQFINDYSGNNLKADLREKLLKMSAYQVNNTNKDSLNNVIETQVTTLTSGWFTYFLKFDPARYIRQLKIPVLAINGSLDVQVSAEENLNGWKLALQKAGNKNFEVTALPGLNHLFQEAATGAVSEYAQTEQTISPKVLSLMKNWILKNTTK